MALSKPLIYLASRSPQRQALLSQIGVDFRVLTMREALLRGPDVNEDPLTGEAAADYTLRIARAKAEAARKRILERRLLDLPVLGADTAVVLRQRIFGKPGNPADAKEMLRALSGRTHQVFTAVAVISPRGTRSVLSRSNVRVCHLDEDDIDSYLAWGEAYDKSGGYAIQGKAAAFIPEISGSYSGVMGLPLFETARLLEESGIRIFHESDKDNKKN